MFVHRIAVVEIADDQRINPAEFRQNFGQQSESLHGTQRDSRIVRTQNFPQHRPWDFRISCGELGVLHDVSDTSLRPSAERYAGSRGLREKRKHHRAVRHGLLIEYLKQPVAHRKRFPVAGLEFRAARGIEQSLPECLRRGALLFEVAEQLPVQGARMTKIQPHPFRGAPRPAIRHAQRALRRGSLQFVRERIVIPRIAVVQKTSDRAEKVHGARCQFFLDRAAVEYFLFLAGDLAQPDCRLVVTKSPRGFFHIRLEVKDGISITRQSLSGQLVEFREQEGPCLSLRSGQHARIEFLAKFAVAGQEPAVQQCQVKLGVVFFDAPAFLDRAARRANTESQVPQRAGEVRDQRPEILFRFLASEQKEYVEIRVGKQKLAAVSAKGQQTQTRWRTAVDTHYLADNSPDVVVRQFTQCAYGFPRAHTRFELLPDTLSLVVGLRAEHRQGRERTLHGPGG